MSSPLGTFIKHGDLSPLERDLIKEAWGASLRAYCPKSDFPVGAAILAVNGGGVQKVFPGNNIENESFSATICAERNAGTTAVGEGYTRFTHVAVVCRKHPGGAPCGLCRQVLRQFGQDAVVLNICDRDSNVYRFIGRELLPAPVGAIESYASLRYADRQVVDRVLRLRDTSYVPYSKKGRGAVVRATDETGAQRRFAGRQIDNASYGGSMTAERSAISAAVSAGFRNINQLVVCGDNPIDGECLQVLREFGGTTVEIVVIGHDKSLVRTTLEQMLPDNFGPQSL